MKWYRLTMAMLLGVPSAAWAQESVTLNRFQAGETTQDDFHISRPLGQGHLESDFQVHLDYANDPLVFETNYGVAGTERERLVANQVNLTLGASLGLWDHWVVFGGLPVVAAMNGEPVSRPDGGAPITADGGGLGNLYLGVRGSDTVANGRIALGFQLTASLPTAGSQRFSGEDTVSLHSELLAEWRIWRQARVVANVGARLRPAVQNEAYNLEFGNELTYGVGVALPVWTDSHHQGTHLDLHVQAFGTTSLDNPFSRDDSPLEFNGGVKFFHQSGLVGGVAAGAGLTRGFGSPDVRVVGMLGFTSPTPGDRDNDGWVDTEDLCPDDPEDRDQFKDTDGCPDLDNDLDGLADAKDACPLQPEDKDGFEDTDGCPELDNDQDQIVDGADKCPLVPGTREGHGCPLVAKTEPPPPAPVKPVCDEEPKPEPELEPEPEVVVSSEKIKVNGVIHFETNRADIHPESFQTLLKVADGLRNHPELGKIRVEGHTDNRGRHHYNVDLSQRRAASVMEYLVTVGGVSRERLVSEGYGPDRPIVPDAQTLRDHAKNRRVEFHVLNARPKLGSLGPTQ